MTALRSVLRRWELVLAVLLVASIAVNAAFTPYFLDIHNLFDSTQLFSEKAIMALPMTLLIIGGDIDLSVASIVALSSTAMGALASRGVGTPGLIAAGLAVGTFAGMFNGAVITGFGVPAIVVTIGTVSLFRGIPAIVLGDQAYTEYPESFAELGQGAWHDLIPYEFLIFVVLAIGFAIALHRTVLGRKLYAYGHNAEAARYSGINVAAHRFWLFTLNGAMCGLASVFLTSRVGATRPNMALGWDLEVIAVVVLGGVSILGGSGTMPGVILAILVMSTVTFGLSLHNVAGIVMSIIVGLLLITSVAAPLVARKLAARRPRPGNEP